MVDPNRKINRLSDDDAAFLEECEKEFCTRYTDADDEFVALRDKPIKPPPIIEPWRNMNHNRRNRGGGNNNWNRNNHRAGGNHQQNHWNHNNRYNDHRQHRNNYNNYRQHNDRPYERQGRRDGDGSGGHGSSYRERPY